MTEYLALYSVVSAIFLYKIWKNDPKVHAIDFFVIVLISAFAAVRGDVGPDTSNYREIYDSFDASFDLDKLLDYEPLFSLYFLTLNYFYLESWVALAGISIFQGYLLYRTSIKIKNAYFVYLYAAIFFLNYEFNILRQGVATQLFGLLLASLFVEEKGRPLFRLLGLVSSSLVHYATGAASLIIYSFMKGISRVQIVALMLVGTIAASYLEVEYLINKVEIYSLALGDGGGRIGPTIVLLPVYLCLAVSVNDKALKRFASLLFCWWLAFRLLMAYHELFGRFETFFAYCLVLVLCSDDCSRNRQVGLAVLFFTGILITIASLYYSKDYITVQGVGDVYLRSPMLPYVIHWDDIRVNRLSR